VAIIIVLGLLAVLMITAVAFSISMRIERRGASNFRHGVQAKHMLWAALANAIDEINGNLDDQVDFYIYPYWAVTNSTAGVFAFEPPEARVISREALDCIPGSLRNAVEQEANPYWREITDEVGHVKGRYAYIVVNCSGLLDANKAGGSNRWAGLNPAEIVIDNVPGMDNSADFLADRAVDVRYETLAELASLNSGVDFGSAPPLAVYSLTRVDQRLTAASNATPKVIIGGDVSTLVSNRTDIEQGFIDSGIEASQASFVFDNLLDYVDTNCVPSDLASACTESVPMISEIRVRARVTDLGGSAEASPARLSIEWHYPFVEPSSYTFDIHYEWKAVLSADLDEVERATTNIMRETESGAYVGQTEHYDSFDSPSVTITTLGSNAVLTSEVKVWVTVGGETSLVEAAPFPTNGYISLPEIQISAGTIIITKGVETFDPRLNWDASDNQQWRPYGQEADTLGTVNYWTESWFDRRTGLDKGRDMHISDRGRLISVGELGNLLQGQRREDKWQTIGLYEKEDEPDYVMHRVFDYFTLTNGMLRGLVNLNSTNDYVLDAVFKEIPLGYPESGNTLTEGQAESVVDEIVGRPREFHDIGELGDPEQVNWVDLLPDMSDLIRESIISHTAGLLTVRQNLFTIIIRAESYSERLGGGAGIKLASAHAVAQVWRDPFRDDNGNHPCFVRYFKLLED